MRLFREPVFRSHFRVPVGLGWLTRGTEKSVHGVQLVPSFAGTYIKCGHMSFGVVVLKSVLEPVSASTGEAV